MILSSAESTSIKVTAVDGKQMPVKTRDETSDSVSSFFLTTALIQRVHCLLIDVIKDELERLKISEVSAVQALILFRLSNDTVTAQEMRSRWYYNGSNPSYNVQKLVSMGYLKRDRSSTDRRAVQIQATPRGRAIGTLLEKLFMKQLSLLETQTTDIAAMMTQLQYLEKFWVKQIRYIY